MLALRWVLEVVAVTLWGLGYAYYLSFLGLPLWCRYRPEEAPGPGHGVSLAPATLFGWAALAVTELVCWGRTPWLAWWQPPALFAAAEVGLVAVVAAAIGTAVLVRRLRR